MSLAEAIEARRSVRDYGGAPLSLEALSRLLHAAQGITEPRRGLRAIPSAGATYPLELYAVVLDVTDLEPGIYRYDMEAHALEPVRLGDFGAALARACLEQEFLARANVCLVIAAVPERTRQRYGERTTRYVLFEAGHAGQNLSLAAAAMGLGSCAIGAFVDDALDDLLGLDGEREMSLYVIAVGTVGGNT